MESHIISSHKGHHPHGGSRKAVRLYLWSALSLGALCLILLAGFAVYLFTRNLEMARLASRERMANLAAYIVDHVEKDPFSYTLVLAPEAMPANFIANNNAWLSQLAKATGLEHVTLTDSVGSIYISSQSQLTNGMSLMQYGADAQCLEMAAHTFRPIYCARKQGTLSIQSLYHPFDFFGTRHLVVLESDSNLLAYLEQYRTFIWAVAIFLFVVLGSLIAALIFIESKARSALQMSRHNEQLAFLGRTSAELAHELKNPLAIIKSSVDVLRRQIDPDRKNQAMNFLSDEVMRLSRLISNILGLSRERELNIRAFDPRVVLNAASEATQELNPDVEFKLTVEAGIKIRGDLDAVRQIVENLLRNAAQAMNGKGTCHLLCESDENHVHLYIGDQGPGIPANLRKSLFDPFVSGNKAGTGLGLAIVRSLIERMDWQIAVLYDSDAARTIGMASVKTCFKLTAPKGEGSV